MFAKLFGKKAEAAVQKFSGRTDLVVSRKWWKLDGGVISG